MRDAGPWLVAGLGNPGERYARTRHNAGAMVVEALCAQLGARRRKVRLVPLFAAREPEPDLEHQGGAGRVGDRCRP